MYKTYSLQASPLYRLRNRKKLAELLELPPTFFRKEHTFRYDEFSRPKLSGGERHFTVPEEALKAIQKRLCRLLTRIETPEWVTSGKKQSSYITNADKHRNSQFVKTMDISSFYDSVNRSYIYNMFKDTFLMEPDIAWLVTDLVTYNKKLPTGSPSSQVIVFWAYREMFDNISIIAKNYNCIFTLYVDDMTFSSQEPIPGQLRKDVAAELKRYRLKAKVEKDHYYQGKSLAVITGVGLKNGKKVLLNRHRKAIIDQFKLCKEKEDIKEIEKLNGMLCSARQIEPDIFPSIMNYINSHQKELQALLREGDK